MSNFAVSNTLSLRTNYSDNRSLMIANNRKSQDNKTLASTDSRALRKAIRSLKDFKFEDSEDETVEEKIKAFIDTYNYTLESGSKMTKESSHIKNAVNQLKKAIDDNESTLEGYGIKKNSKGYLTLSSSSVSNIEHEHYKEIFGSDSEMMKKLNTAAQKINSHVDIYL